jgi:hypothetical protein
MMKTLLLKKRILEEGKAKHQSVIDDYRRGIQELQSSKTGDLDGTMDIQQMSQHSEINERISHMAEQLNFAVDEMNILNRIIIEEPLHESVTLGTVVETDKRTFFVSVSIEEFKVDGKEFYGLSQKTPLYAEMAGKKKGDTFAFRNMKYKIKKIF